MNYFAAFIEDFVHRAKPLYDVLSGFGFHKKKRKRKPAMMKDFTAKWGPEKKIRHASI